MIGAFYALGALASGAWGYAAYEEMEGRRKRSLARGRGQSPPRLRTDLGRAARGILTGRAQWAFRLGAGFVLGLISLALGGSVVLALVLVYLGAMLPASLRALSDAARRRTAEAQVPSYLSAVTMGYLVTGDLGRAGLEAARDFAAPLGDWLRDCAARARTHQGTFGEALWEMGRAERIRPVMRLGQIVRRAEAGGAQDDVLRALDDLADEIREDDRIGREKRVAARQGSVTVQAGAALLGVFYVYLAVTGDGSLLAHTTFGLVATAGAALFAGMAYLVARRAQTATAGRRRRGAR